jgi:glycosyltransferase involved in cell wall biosynthesis
MVGNYKRQKGHDVFLRMSAKIASRFDSAVFLIAGSPTGGRLAPSRAYQKEIEALAVQLSLRHRCHFIENEEDMAGLYNACDTTALLSRREGTPNVLLESMACGIPVVATAIADNGFIVEEGVTGFLVPVDDYCIPAERMEVLLRDKVLRTGIGEKARARALAEFALTRTAHRLEQVYVANFIGAA